MFYLVGIFRTPEWTFLKRWGKEWGYIEIYNKRQVVWTSVWEDARVHAHWNHSFYMHLSCLGPVSCVFHILPHLPLAPQCSPQGVASASWLPDSRYCSSWAPSGLRNSHLRGWNCCWLWHPCLLIWQEILHFSM